MNISRILLTGVLVATAACTEANQYHEPDGAPDATNAANPDGPIAGAIGDSGGAAPERPGSDSTPDTSLDTPVPAADAVDAPSASPDMGVSCATGTHLCRGTCVDDRSANSCGTSCDPCPDVKGGSATCDGTKCGAACPQGKKVCLGECIPDFQPCAGSCPSGTHNCGGACAEDKSVNSCGRSCVPCPTPAGGIATCDGTACSFTCQVGKRCGSECVAGCCADIDCPMQAGRIGRCNTSSHQCSYSCAAGTKPCQSGCIPESGCCVDDDCSGNLACVGNVCASGTCRSGFKVCNSSCVRASACCANTDCAVCQKCVSGNCQVQTESEDLKDECGSGACRTGYCNGAGACDLRVSGMDPAGVCQSSTCKTGLCTTGGMCAAAPSGQQANGCNGVCQQCNAQGACRTDSQVTCYEDKDGDGFGNKDITSKACGVCPSGFVADSSDCYDGNAGAHPPTQEKPVAFHEKDRGDGSFDYDCDNTIIKSDYMYQQQVCSPTTRQCEYPNLTTPGCGEMYVLMSCAMSSGSCYGAASFPAWVGCK